MKKTMLFLVAAFATMSVFAQLPKAGDKGYLYDSKSELFVTAEGTLGQTGELFTIKDEGTTHPDKNGTQLPDFRFLTNHQATGDHGEGQTMLSVRNTEKVTTTEDYGYGVFSLYLNDAGTAFRIMNAKNNNRGIHLQFDCLGYEGTTLKFVAEADAPYWTFMSEEDYKKLKGISDDPENDYTGPGYSNLEASMFMEWDDAVNPTTSKAAVCEYHINDPAITVYGDANLPYLNYADLSEYDKLIVVVTSDNPRMYFNKVDGGKYNASDEAASGRIEITPAGGWAQKYYTVEDDIWTVDLKKIVEEKGYARLNGIKGPTYDTTVTVSKMVLFKDTATRISAVTEQTTTDNIIYNLSGQQQKTLQKGLNIVGGKKLFVK